MHHFNQKVDRLKSSFSKLINNSRSHSKDESILKPRLIWSKLIIYFLLGTTSVSILYAFSVSLDEVAVVQGELKPVGNVSDVKSAVPGSVEIIRARDGDLVAAAQSIIKLDSTITKSKLDSLKLQKKLLSMRTKDQENIYKFRKSQLSSQAKSLAVNLYTQKLIANRYRPLVQQGAIQELQLLEQQTKINAIESELQQTKSRLGELYQNYLKERKESGTSLSELDRQITETARILQYEDIKAPVAGRIFDMLPSRPGSVVATGETLFKVVPNLKLEAKVFVTNQFIGFLKKGQKAEVRLDAYPFTEYGSIRGQLSSISYESLQPTDQFPYPRFIAKIQLETQTLNKNGAAFPLKSGQTLTANIILRKRRVASLFTDIIDRALDSMRAIRGSQT